MKTAKTINNDVASLLLRKLASVRRTAFQRRMAMMSRSHAFQSAEQTHCLGRAPKIGHAPLSHLLSAVTQRKIKYKSSKNKKK